MKTKECPSCAMDVEETATQCTFCSYEFAGQKSSLKWLALLMLVLFAYPLIQLFIRFVKSIF